MLKKFIDFIKNGVWERRETKRGSGGWLVRPFKIALYTVRGIGQHDIFLRAAAMTFFTLMSLVPIFALMFGIMRGFGFEGHLVDLMYAKFPDYKGLVDTLFEFVGRMTVYTRGDVVSGVSIIVLLWSVIRVFGYMDKAFGAIWGVSTPRSATRKLTDYITVIFLAPIVLVATVSLSTTIRSSLSWLHAEWLLNLMFTLASIALLCMLFAFIYWVLPNTRVKFRGALIAAILAGTVFYLFSTIYFYIQGSLSAINAIYGTFAAVPLFLIWLQTSWIIFLVGAELSFAYQNIEQYQFERRATRMDANSERKVLLATMLVIARSFVSGHGGVSAEDVAAQLELPLKAVRDRVSELENAGLVVAIKETRETDLYMPARDVHTMTVYDVIDGVEHGGEVDISVGGLPKFKKVNELLDQISAVAAKSEHNLKIGDLI